jgi:hypothetical protein
MNYFLCLILAVAAAKNQAFIVWLAHISDSSCTYEVIYLLHRHPIIIKMSISNGEVIYLLSCLIKVVDRRASSSLS